MSIDVLVDLQFGSTGKGLLAGFLGVENRYDMVISANMPNAGHSAYCPKTGQLFVHKVLPSAIFSPSLRAIGIGPGAVFSIPRIVEEWKAVCQYRDDLTLVIHEAAGILTPDHKRAEEKTLSRIASTMQGSAEALISKIRREDKAIAAHWNFALMERLTEYGKVKMVTQHEWLSIIRGKGNILCEGSQGYSLGISAGFYPYCTSRDCTPARVLADCAVPLNRLGSVYGSCRVHPIRVGNTADGSSGGWYPDQRETTFEAVGVKPELTTVTQRIRRIASFSKEQIFEAMAMAMPSAVFLNFANYDPEESGRVKKMIDSAAAKLGCGGVRYIGWGPKSEDIGYAV